MKKSKTVMPTLICLAAVTAWFMPTESFGQAKVSFTKVEVRKQKEKTVKIDDEQETDSRRTSTSGKRQSETATVKVTLKNGGDQPVTGLLQWAFVSDFSSGKQDPKDKEKPMEPEETIFSADKKTITLAAGESVEETIVSQPFVFEEKTVETEKFDTESNNTSVKDIQDGNVYKGYIVLFVVDGQVVASKANTSSYTKPNWIAQCRNPPPPPKKGKK
jgi:hypothetical protein